MPTKVTLKRGVYVHKWVGNDPAHALLAPSDSERWLACSGYHYLTLKLRKNKNIPPDTPGRAAAEGSLAHWILEQCGLHGYKPKQYLGQRHEVDGFRFIVDFEMIDGVTMALEYIEDLHFFNHVKQDDTEQWLDLTYLKVKHLDGGTSDRLVYTKNKHLYVIDFKYGKGPVDPYTSTQLRIYGVGALKKYPKAKTVTLVIVQPRCPTGRYIKEYTLPAIYLKQWKNEVLLPRANAVHEERDSYTITEKGCKYCPAKRYCPVQEQMIKLVQAPREWLTAKEQIAIYNARKAIIATLDDIAESLMYDVNNGAHKNALKVVHANTQRRVIPEAVIEFFGDDAYTRKLIGVTEVDRLLKSGKYVTPTEALIEKPLGRPELAPLEDKRPPMAKDEFAEFIE